MALQLTSTSTEWVSLPEVKDFANITTSTSDDEIDLIREAAQDVVEGIVGPVLWRNVTETVTVIGGIVVLTHRPVISFTSLTTADGSPVTYTAASATAGVLSRIRIGGIRDLTATYVAGRTTVPAAIRVATLIIAAHLWQTQLGSAPTTQLQDNFAAEPTVGVGYAIPNRAVDLLAPYLLLPGVS